MRQINRYTAISPAVHLTLDDERDDPSPSPTAGSSHRGTPPPPPPPPAAPAPPRSPPRWHQNIPELADAIAAVDDGEGNNNDDDDENEYTLLDYMRFLAPRQRAVEVALEKMVAAEARRVSRRVEEWARAVEIW